MGSLSNADVYAPGNGRGNCGLISITSLHDSSEHAASARAPLAHKVSNHAASSKDAKFFRGPL